MTKIVNLLIEDGRIEGKKEGKRESIIETILSFLTSVIGNISSEHNDIIRSLSQEKMTYLLQHLNEVKSLGDLNWFL